MTFIMLKKKNFTVHLLLTNPAAVFLNDICLRNFHITVSIFSTRKRAVGNSWHYITSCSLNLTLQTIKKTFVTVDFIVPPKSTWMMKILVTLLTFKGFSLVWNLSCLFRIPAALKHLPHCLHLIGFFPVWTLLCVCKPTSWRKRFSSLWTLSCLLRSPDWLKHLPQCLHS